MTLTLAHKQLTLVRPLKTTHTETKYIVFKLSDDNKEIVVEKTSESGNYDEFVGDLPAESCRYAIYDFEYEKGEGKRNKICFYAW